jgi:hypothetical protein
MNLTSANRSRHDAIESNPLRPSILHRQIPRQNIQCGLTSSIQRKQPTHSNPRSSRRQIDDSPALSDHRKRSLNEANRPENIGFETLGEVFRRDGLEGQEIHDCGVVDEDVDAGDVKGGEGFLHDEGPRRWGEDISFYGDGAGSEGFDFGDGLFSASGVGDVCYGDLGHFLVSRVGTCDAETFLTPAAPRRANSMAMPAPIPLEPPVTMAILPARDLVCVISFALLSM